MLSPSARSLSDFLTSTRETIVGGKLNRALHDIYNAVEWIFTEPLCTDKVYGSESLDELCQEIGRRSFAQLKAIRTEAAGDVPTYAYIATRLQRSGGHTRVLRDFILSRPNARHVLLITGLVGKSDLEWLGESFNSLAHFQLELAPRSSYAEKLTWLQKRLLELAPSHSYLFHHHQDAVAIAAIIPEMKLAASFSHHGDHHLCLGTYLKHVTHLDFHPMGYHSCRSGLKIDNRYIPLTLPDKGPRAATPFMPTGILTTATAAGSNKLEIPYPYRYTEVIPALLEATGGTHLHIGRLSSKARDRINRNLTARGLPLDRFVYIPWVESVWKTLQERGVDLYVTSFPYVGALTMIEAMGAGIPLITHRNIMSRLLSGSDMAYPGAASWRKPEELFTYCTSLTPENLVIQSKAARAHYEHYHNGAHLAEMLDPAAPAITAPPLTTDYQPESDAWAWWATSQVTLRQWLWRTAYRTYRRVRATLA